MTRLKDLMADLECVIQELSDRVAALTDAVDALSDEVQWRNNHTRHSDQQPSPFVLTSMPLDPGTDDWQLNRKDRSGHAAQLRRAPKGTLFD